MLEVKVSVGRGKVKRVVLRAYHVAVVATSSGQGRLA